MWNKYVVITVGGWVDPLLPSTLPPALYPPPDGHQTGNETEYGDQQDNQLLLRGENRNSEKKWKQWFYWIDLSDSSRSIYWLWWNYKIIHIQIGFFTFFTKFAIYFFTFSQIFLVL